jgi:thymidine kinase
MSAKLYFRYGAMGSSKSANLIMTAYNYKVQGKKIMILKPGVDTRDEKNSIVSRTGMKQEIDLLTYNFTYIPQYIPIDLDCVLVDECQFLEVEQIDQLRYITKYCPVICYGLRTDYSSKLFPSSQRLMEIADNIEEIKTTCVYCNKKAIINAKYKIDGDVKIIIKSGSANIDIGGDDKYQAMCWNCWNEK